MTPLVAICVPTFDIVQADFCFALAALTHSPGANLALINTKSSMICKSRNEMVGEALGVGADYLLFLDSDMVFPCTVLKQLLAREKDIVGGTYPSRVPPHKAMGITLDYQPLEVSGGLVEMAAIPTGCLLVNMRVFETLAMPWFQHPLVERDGVVQPQGEDYFFCDQARAAGFSVWLDVDVSLSLGHIGQQIHRIPKTRDVGEAA